MTAPTFPRFAAAPKCDPALLLTDNLLLDRPTRRIVSPARRELLWAVLLAAIAWQSWHNHDLRTRVGELERIDALRTELARIVRSEEAQRLMAEDRVRAAGMPGIQGAEC